MVFDFYILLVENAHTSVSPLPSYTCTSCPIGPAALPPLACVPRAAALRSPAVNLCATVSSFFMSCSKVSPKLLRLYDIKIMYLTFGPSLLHDFAYLFFFFKVLKSHCFKNIEYFTRQHEFGPYFVN